jgi:hypothetical protein
MKYSGPAFPVIGKHNPHGTMEIYSSGMTLRDYFAGRCLAGVMSIPGAFDGEYDDFCYTAKRAYEIADAMIKTREEGNDSEKT